MQYLKSITKLFLSLLPLEIVDNNFLGAMER